MSETWTFPEPEPSKEWDEARRLINETTQKWMRDRVESFERYCVTRIVQIVREEIAKSEPAPPVAERGEWTGESLCGLLVQRRYLHGCWDDRNEVERTDLESLARDINAGPPLTTDAPSKP